MQQHNLTNKILSVWYSNKKTWLWLLWPIQAILLVLVSLRIFLFRKVVIANQIDCPVIIVGNLTVGGTGKTPLVKYLVNQLQSKGFKPGIISRGYGGSSQSYPLIVDKGAKVTETGDEPYMLAKSLRIPVVVDPDRSAAANCLLQNFDCNVIISDDGLQHYQLARNFEILVLDGNKQLGNQWLMPLGPLREPVYRKNSVDWIVQKEGQRIYPEADRYRLQATALVSLNSGERLGDFSRLQDQPIYAIAGIGQPESFFELLKKLGIQADCIAFDDHYAFQPQDLAFAKDKIVIMTEKDAVKCDEFAQNNWWYLEVNPVFDDEVPASLQRIMDKLENQH